MSTQSRVDDRARTSLRHLRAFVEVAAAGSFTKAAQTLYVTQSALTLTIRQLEDDLGLQLFDRTTRSTRPTAAGEEFLPSARRVLSEFQRAVRDMRALARRERGRVGLAAVPSIMALVVPQVMAQYVGKHPGVDLYMREDNSGGVESRVISGDVDFGISSPLTEHAQLDYQPLLEDRYGVVSAPDYVLARRRSALRWSDIGEARVIGFSTDLGMQRQLAERSDLPAAVREPRYQVSNTSAINDLVRAGLGISVLSALAARRPPLDGLPFRLLTQPAISRVVCVITIRGRKLSPAAREFHAMLLHEASRLRGLSGVRMKVE
jgi:DNA-binding transcriptional LysR family regulator